MPLACLILAAGKGTRMYSDMPKVLHPVCGRPMLFYPLLVARTLGIRRIYTVVSPEQAQIRRLFEKETCFVIQKKQLGTADAVKSGLGYLKTVKGDLLLLSGDAPLITAETLRFFLRQHKNARADVSILSCKVTDPAGYGRMVRDDAGAFWAIREERDASPRERAITEINGGIYAFRCARLREAITEVSRSNRQGEYYLTEVPELIRKKGGRIHIYKNSSASEVLGVNTRADLATVQYLMNARQLKNWSDRGVTIMDPATTYIEHGVRIGRDTTIYPCTYIEKEVRIGRKCSIGPFAKLRSGTSIGDETVIGSFVEVVRTKVGKRTAIKHLTYLGDTMVGDNVNVGAGTVTANFDGQKKHRTQIGARTFLGCNTVLIAPVRLGKGSKTGAGAVVCAGRDVKRGDTVVGVPARSLRKINKN